MKKLFLVFLMLSTAAFSQFGIGTTTPEASAALDITATNRALLLPRVANTIAITSPLNGMLIYDIASKCVRVYANGNWGNCLNGAAAASLSSNGTAVVSAYACSTASAGFMTIGAAVSGVTQTITATVATVGTYSISAIANGVTFSGSGTFAGTGAQNIVLTASGTPAGAGNTNSYTLNTSPSCSFNRVVAANVPVVTSPYTARLWMDRNLGATRLAQTLNDHLAYGDLYQWGRNADGHQSITWTNATTGTPVNTTTTTTSTNDQSANALYITNATDWRTTPNNNLWQGVTGTNNPCPIGFRLPTTTEIESEITGIANDINTGAGTVATRIKAFSSVFKFTTTGQREVSTGNFSEVGVLGAYWTGANSGNNRYRFTSGGGGVSFFNRSGGCAVRCIREQN